MSECDRARALLEDALHGHLGPDERHVVGAHLTRCTSCRALYDRVDRQRTVVAAFAPRPNAPPALRAALSRPPAPRRPAGWLAPALGGALAATLLLGLALAAHFDFALPPPPAGSLEALAREAVDDHVRVVLRRRSGASGPSDPKALQALMASVLDFPVPAPARGDGRFQLEGGRPSYVAGRAVACFYYRSPSAYASLFLLPLDRLGRAARAIPDAPEVRERSGHRVAFWRHGDYAYVAVSDGDADELAALATTLRRL